jgi:hypothetical protein
VTFPQRESSEVHTLQFSMLVLFLLGTQFNHRCAGCSWEHPALSKFDVLCLVFRWSYFKSPIAYVLTKLQAHALCYITTSKMMNQHVAVRIVKL